MFLLGFLDMKEVNESSFVAQVFEEPFLVVNRSQEIYFYFVYL